MRYSRAIGLVLLATLAGCGSGNLASKESDKPGGGPVNRYDPDKPGLFGEGGFTLGKVVSGDLFSSRTDDGTGSTAPVNRYLWQGALDTVSFMPLASTDPYSGVIATDWSSTPSAPNERFKVTVYLTNPQLAATSVKVAVYRQARDASGNWVQTNVDPATPRKIEDAILTRARQIRIAELEADDAA